MTWQKINSDQYAQLLEHTPFHTLWHTPAWLDFLSATFSWLQIEFWACDDAILPTAHIGKNHISLPFCEYAGALPITENPDWNSILADTPTDFQIHFHPRILTSSDPTNLQTWILDLDQSPEKIHQNLRQTLRHTLRKSEQNGVQITRATSADLPHFYKIYLHTMRRNGSPAFPRAFFEWWMKSEDVDFLVAKKDGEVLAGSVFVHHQNWVHYFINAASRPGASLGANYLLVWNMIKKHANSPAVLDFGAVRPDTPAAIFKKGWGTKPLWIKSQPAHGIGEPDKMARAIWQHLPLLAIEKLSPTAFKVFLGK